MLTNYHVPYQMDGCPVAMPPPSQKDRMVRLPKSTCQNSIGPKNCKDGYLDRFTSVSTSLTAELQMRINKTIPFQSGYVLLHLPSGMLVQRFGAKIVLILVQLPTAIVTLITPMAVDFAGANALICLRLLMGVAHGGLFPAVATTVSTWTPKSERTLLTAILFTGLPVS